MVTKGRVVAAQVAVVAVAAAVAAVLLINGPEPRTLTQKECVKGIGGVSYTDCPATVRGMFDPSSLALSPDGRFLYAVSVYSGRSSTGADVPGGSVVSFSRNQDTGNLDQLDGKAGCVRDRDAPVNPNTKPCPDIARGIDGAKHIALSPDGRYAYVAGLNNGSIAAFSRDAESGALTQLPGVDACVEDVRLQAKDKECTRTAKALSGVRWVESSPDGKFVYASAPASDAIAAFKVNPNGGLEQIGCVQDVLARVDQGCPKGRAVNYPRMVAVTDRQVYVASDSADRSYVGDAADGDAVGVFDRDPDTGELSQPKGRECVEDIRADSQTTCPVKAPGLLQAYFVLPAGDRLYAASTANRTGSLAVLGRAADGSLSEGPCYSGFGCQPTPEILGAEYLAVHGDTMYAAAFFGLNLTALHITPQGVERFGCVKDVRKGQGDCPTAKGLEGPRAIVVSPDGRFVYVAASTSGAIATFEVAQPEPTPTETVPPPTETTPTETVPPTDTAPTPPKPDCS